MDDSTRPVHLEQALAALSMPRPAVEQWLDDIHQFCEQHGGRRHYAELLDLIEQCKEEMER